jgi:uncharacterized damage-inducible protein DinB
MTSEFASILRRDLTKLLQEVEGFPEEGLLWETPPGMNNSPGNLVLHLEGNLREYIGRQLGGVPYDRDRPLEFSAKNLTRTDLASRVESLIGTIPQVVEQMADSKLEETYPEDVLGRPLTVSHFLLHLIGHLNYHLGQIDAARRGGTQKGPVEFARV